MDGDGNLVVVELKRGQTPREVTSQALEYSSWVKNLEFDEITGIADSYLGGSGSLGTAFREKFGTELPEQFNQAHRSLVIAESVDASTDRIVRYLVEMEVPINVATVQHFEDANGRELLAQVPDPDAVPIVREAFESSLRGNGLKEICRELNDRSITSKGYRRHKSGLHHVLTNEVYTGTAVWGKTTRSPTL